MRFPRICSALLLASTLGACHSNQLVTAPVPEASAPHASRPLAYVIGAALIAGTVAASASLFGSARN
jgi:hypothetical protein